MRANKKRLIQNVTRGQGIRPEYSPHVFSILMHCQPSEADMQASLTSLYKWQRRFFF
jgi:hypothetical protein